MVFLSDLQIRAYWDWRRLWQKFYFSGTPPRFVACVLNILFIFSDNILYEKIKKDPTKSMNYEPACSRMNIWACRPEMEQRMWKPCTDESAVYYHRSLCCGVVVCVFFTIQNGWGTKQIASWFLSLGIISGIISGFSINKIAKTFIKGCQPMVFASFMVGLASAVSLI